MNADYVYADVRRVGLHWWAYLVCARLLLQHPGGHIEHSLELLGPYANEPAVRDRANERLLVWGEFLDAEVQL